MNKVVYLELMIKLKPFGYSHITISAFEFKSDIKTDLEQIIDSEIKGIEIVRSMIKETRLEKETQQLFLLIATEYGNVAIDVVNLKNSIEHEIESILGCKVRYMKIVGSSRNPFLYCPYYLI